MLIEGGVLVEDSAQGDADDPIVVEGGVGERAVMAGSWSQKSR